MTVTFEQGVPVALNGERLGLVELIDRAARARVQARGRDRRPRRGPDRRPEVRDIYEVPAAAIILTAHAELERLVGTIHENRFKPALDQQWGYLVYAGLWWEPLRLHLDAYMDSVNERVTGTIGLKLYKGHVAPSRASRPTRSTTLSWRRSSPGARCSASRRRPGSSSCGRCSRGWPGGCAIPTRGSLRGMSRAGTGYELVGRAAVKGSRWYLRRRYGRFLPSRRTAFAAVAGLAALGAAAASLAHRGEDVSSRT